MVEVEVPMSGQRASNTRIAWRGGLLALLCLLPLGCQRAEPAVTPAAAHVVTFGNHDDAPVERDTTERPEAVEAGCATLVGTARLAIVAEGERLWRDEAAYGRMHLTGNPFGDGSASQRIVDTLARHFSTSKAAAFAAA